MSCIAPGGRWIVYTQSNSNGLDLDVVIINPQVGSFTGSLGGATIFGTWVTTPGAPCNLQFLTYPDPQIPFPGEFYTGTQISVGNNLQYLVGMFSPSTLDIIADILSHRPIPPPESWIAVKQ
jgi:hypothetical protein